ncbi:MAG: DUF167 domain-containing protein [Kiritimatiellae bacterium]|nr:DUF167 domain-containing protein [Kiritimatiellia bacterium]
MKNRRQAKPPAPAAPAAAPAPAAKGWYEVTADGVVVSVKAVPRSSTAGIDGLYGDEALKVRIKAAPVEGKANKELTETLARVFGIPKSAAEIKGGATSKHKRILLRGLTAASFQAAMPNLGI